MMLKIIGKILIPIISGFIAYYFGEGKAHVLVGISFGLIIDILWSNIEQGKHLNDMSRHIKPLMNMLEYPLMLAKHRRVVIENALNDSDEIYLITNTATGWLNNYITEFESRIKNRKNTVLFILDPNVDSFRHVLEKQTFRFDPVELRIPYQLLTSAETDELRAIDNEFQIPNKTQQQYSQHFEKKYRCLVQILTKKNLPNFKVTTINNLSSVNFILSRKMNFFDEFYTVFKNDRDSDFDVLAKIDVSAGKLYENLLHEFRRTCDINGVTIGYRTHTL